MCNSDYNFYDKNKSDYVIIMRNVSYRSSMKGNEYNRGRKRKIMQDLGNTQFFQVEVEPETGVKVILSAVFEALTEKGYNPVNQIVGYIMSGDPTYITSYKNARSLIMKVERDELVEELFREYIKNNHWV